LKQWVLVVLVMMAAGCAVVPGQRVNESDLLDKPRAGGRPAPDLAIIDITPELLVRQAEERSRRPAPREDPLAEQANAYDYRIAPHDVLTVIVWNHPELTIPAGEFRAAEAVGNPVTAAGNLFYPHVGVVHVAGKTLSEVRELLTERLSAVLQRPQLDVKVAAFRGYRVQVTGELVAPGTMPITDVPARALDAVAFAKGPGPEADLRNVTLSRKGQVHVLDLQAVNERGVLAHNWLLQDGDVLHVPDRSQNKVFVMGEVQRPASRIMVKGRMTLAEAINDAEGFNPLTSNPGGVYVFRGSYAKPAMYKIDARSPDAMLLAAQFELQPQDVVYVSSTSLTKWNRVVQQILPTIQSLWQTADLANRAIP
jgi:polysaccharide biosynthesis/export protein